MGSRQDYRGGHGKATSIQQKSPLLQKGAQPQGKEGVLHKRARPQRSNKKPYQATSLPPNVFGNTFQARTKELTNNKGKQPPGLITVTVGSHPKEVARQYLTESTVSNLTYG